MKTVRRLGTLLLGLLMLLALLPAPAQAAGRIDLDRAVSLTLTYRDGQTGLSGAPFALHLVATVDAYGTLTKTAAFGAFQVDIRGKDDEAWRALASTLEGYVLRDGLTPLDTVQTDRTGMARFPSGGKTLTPGLYLVVGQRHTQGGRYYDPAPFLVLLPSLDREANDWIYDVTANVKYESRTDTDRPSRITRKVLKVWKDEGHEAARPQEVVVQLLRDGEVYDTVTLNAANDWRYTWSSLSDRYQWTVVEKTAPEGYTVTVTREGTTFVVTNTYPETPPPDEPDQPPTPPGPPDEPDQPPTPPDQPDQPGTPDQPSTPSQPGTPSTPDRPTLPQTGQLWWPVPVLLCAGLALVIAGLLRRRGETDG